MPPKGKVKNAPNQHDKRHESGLAPPGKRVIKQRSNGQLNGSSNGKSVSPPALPPTGLNQGFKFPRTADNPTTTHPSSAVATPPAIAVAAGRDHVAAATSTGERDRTASDASLEEIVSYGEMVSHQGHDAMGFSMGVDGRATSNLKMRSPNANSPTVSTILAYYPLRDAISILILLLSLPPTFVLLIQALFTSLTFVPPTASLSLSTLPNIKEIFNSSNFGYPAMATTLIVDLIFYLCYLLVWKPVQNVFIDLSQAVIAISLSGAAAGTGGSKYSIATCTFIVCVVHVLRYKAIHLTALDYLRSVIGWMSIEFDFNGSSSAKPPLDSSSEDGGWALIAIRTFLGIHIFSQGVTTCIRRSLVKANERDQNAPAINKTDTEAAVGAEPSSRTAAGLADASPSIHPVTNTDGRPSGPALSHRDSRTRESTKKKRKQVNQVRSQQPFWAAIASTKVTFVKEMEQWDAADDGREASAMNNNNVTKTTSTTITNTTTYNTDRVWICEVRDTEICFCVELSSKSVAQRSDETVDASHLGAGIDKTKPFYVCINGAAWSSTRIMANLADNETCEDSSNRYFGEIFGLAPVTSYHCEIVSIADHKILCSAGLVTQPAPTTEQAASAPVQTQHQALRPSSPITTLRQSIQSAEAKLHETRNRSKKTKKDQRSTHADIKKEINVSKGKLESSGGADDKLERRLLQITQHKNQADEATAELKQQIDAFGEVPEEDVAMSEAQKSLWQSALDAKDGAQRDFDDARTERDRELGAMKFDINGSETKREKLTARITQRGQDLEKLIAKQHADATAKQQREDERAHISIERKNKFDSLIYHINTMDAEITKVAQKTQDLRQQIHSLSGWAIPPTSGYPSYSSPPTPEGVLSGNSTALSSPPNGYANFAFGPHQAFNPSFRTGQSTVNVSHPAGAPRGRSSSMLSQYSGFTDNGEDLAYTMSEARHQHSWPMQGSNNYSSLYDDRKESDGDGSGSGSGGGSLTNGSTNGSNSPRPEARPFVPTVGTIGPPSSKLSQNPVSNDIGAVGNGR